MMTTAVEGEQMKLAVVLSYWAGDEPQAMALARVLADLEPAKRGDVVLVFLRDAECPDSQALNETARYCSRSFSIMKAVSGRLGKAHPAGANAIWGGGMELLARIRRNGALRLSTVFLCEPDGGPLCPDWIDRLKAAHARTLASGKRITGAVAEFSQCGLHVNGNMVMELDVWDDHPSLHVTPDWCPWDVYHRKVLMAECRPSNVIRNEYDSYGWSMASLAGMGKEEVAWLHGSRDGSVLEYARRLAARVVRDGEVAPPEPSTDLFLVTYPPDYQWLPYLFRSIDQRVIGFRRLVMVLEDGYPEPPALPWYVTVKRCRSFSGEGHGRHFSQPVEKLRAFRYTDADRVLFIDSDCVFTEMLDVAIYEPPVIVAPWDRVGDALCWYEPTKLLLGFEPPFETMRRFPFVYPTWFLRELWQHLGGHAGIAARRAQGLTAIPDFNLMGNYAIMRHPDKFELCREGCEGLPPRVIRQFWSHGGLTPEVLAELDELGLSGAPRAAGPAPADPATPPPSEPTVTEGP